jgi:hypothetical protein
MDSVTTTQENEIIINSVTGKVATNEIYEYIAGNVKNWIGKPVIWDFSTADFSDVTFDSWQTLLLRLKPLSEIRRGEKTALISSHDPSFGMMRMFDLIAEDKVAINIRSFRKIDEAKAWLEEEEK